MRMGLYLLSVKGTETFPLKEQRYLCPVASQYKFIKHLRKKNSNSIQTRPQNKRGSLKNTLMMPALS